MSEETKQYLTVVLLVIIFNIPLAYIALVMMADDLRRQLKNEDCIGFIYALGFKSLSWRPGWATGARGGLIHWALATVVTGLASKKHPKRKHLAMPGFGGFALGRKSGLGFLVGHVVYGTLFGWQYGRKGRG
jgi:hypothetical protein